MEHYRRFVHEIAPMRSYLMIFMLGFLILSLFILTSSYSQAAPATGNRTWYVATWGNDSNDCRSWKTACRTINEARYRSNTGDVIRIGPGTFKESVNIFSSVTLIGSGPNRTVVDGKGEDSVFTIYSGASVHLSHMTIRNGLATDIGRGGAITNWGSLTVDYVVIANNRGAGGQMVGGLASSGPVTITNSAILNNSAPGGYGGLTAEDTLYMENVTVAGNKALQNGMAGAMMLHTTARATLVNVTVSGNEGFFSTGGILNGGNLSLVNVTLANHSAVSTSNTEVDIYNTGRVTFKNTIISGGCLGEGTFTSQGHNLERTNTCGLNQSTDKTNVNPKLAPLAYNGGLGKTHALQSGSPAIDAGDDTACSPSDQRGVPRWDGDGDGHKTCDIGAYEFVPSSVQTERIYLALVK